MDNTEAAIQSIITQFAGGEHRLAGARASQLIYGNRKTPDENTLERIKAGAVGIERYISAPETPTVTVPDQSGDPRATQPENRPETSNRSSDREKAKQDAIDETLKAGRERGEKAPKEDKALLGSTKMNPDEGPATTPKGKPGK